MRYAKVTDQKIKNIGYIHELFPSTSFTDGVPNSDFIATNSLVAVNDTPIYDAATQRTEIVDPYFYQGEVRTWRVVDLTAEEREAQQTYAQQVAWQSVRSQRDQILRDTDWTQLSDAPVDHQAWAIYRQALRDITTQADPQAITWPTRP